MKKRKIISLIAVLILAAFTMTACGISYGNSFENIDALKLTLSDKNFMYPEFSADGDYEKNYISIYDQEAEKNIGYKIYHMCEPFYIGIYAYDSVSDKPMSVDVNDLTKEDEVVATNYGDVEIYTGATKEDNLFVLGVIHIDGQQYEVRVINNKQMENGKYINAILKDNGNFEKATSVVANVIDSIK